MTIPVDCEELTIHVEKQQPGTSVVPLSVVWPTQWEVMESGALSSTQTTEVFDQPFEDMQSPVDQFVCRPQQIIPRCFPETTENMKIGGRHGSQNVCFHIWSQTL